MLPSGESVYNNRKNNTTHNLHALVHHVYVTSKEVIIICLTTVLQATLLMHSLHFLAIRLKDLEHKQIPIIIEIVYRGRNNRQCITGHEIYIDRLQ